MTYLPWISRQIARDVGQGRKTGRRSYPALVRASVCDVISAPPQPVFRKTRRSWIFNSQYPSAPCLHSGNHSRSQRASRPSDHTGSACHLPTAPLRSPPLRRLLHADLGLVAARPRDRPSLALATRRSPRPTPHEGPRRLNPIPRKPAPIPAVGEGRERRREEARLELPVHVKTFVMASLGGERIVAVLLPLEAARGQSPFKFPPKMCTSSRP